MPEGVRSPHPIDVVWEGGKRFRGGIPGGPTLVMDGDRTVAPSPVDSLLVSLATCSGIDVVEILEKRRTPVTSLSIRLEFSRAPNPPRRLTEVVASFKVQTASDRHHVERALDLSFEKYCSVTNSLAPDIIFTWFLEVIPLDSPEVAV
jgi:putative redox protein